MRLYSDLRLNVTPLRDAYSEMKKYKEVHRNKPRCLLEEGRECRWAEAPERQSAMLCF